MNINAMKKLRSKYTGNIGRLVGLSIDDGKYEAAITIDGEDRYRNFYYDTMEQFMENWEDYEEPKQQYYIKENGDIGTCGAIEDDIPDEMLSEMKSIGNYFETKEEAEKAVEKLKAWKRLKDKGFRFILDEETEMPMFIYSGANGEKCITNAGESKQCRSDIKILFGGKE